MESIIKKGEVLFFIILASVVMAVSSGQPVRAESERDISADASMAVISQYIWRGYEQSRDSIIIQPSITFGYNGFSANIWQSIDTDPWSDTENLYETDFTLSYDTEIKGVSVGAGWIWYALPDAVYDSQEFYVTAQFDLFLEPTITIYREFYHAPSTYITVGLSHAIDIAIGRINSSLNLGIQGSYLISNDEGSYADPNDIEDEYNNFHDGLISAELSIPVNAHITLTPSIYWSFPLCDDAADDMKGWAKDNLNHKGKDNFIYGGVNIGFKF